MNETIGVKGGHNDQLRTKRIKEKKRKKEEDEELEQLEKEVKRQQKFTLINTIPLVLIAGTIKVLYDVGTGKKKVDKEEVNSKWHIKEYDTDCTTMSRQEEARKKAHEKARIKAKDKSKKSVENSNVSESDISERQPDIPISETIVNSQKQENNNIIIEKEYDENYHEYDIDRLIERIPKNTEYIDNINSLEDIQDIIFSPGVDYSNSNINSSDLNEKTRKIFEKLKSRKIIDEYEKKLKDIRFDLRQVIYDYNVLVTESDSDEMILSEDARIILEKLTEIITKIEELKRKIEIENLDKYDDNYIYTLIEGYLKEFKDKKIVSEIKDSSLYIMVEEKLDEIDAKKDKLEKKVSKKKEELEEKEIKFEDMKKKFYDLKKINDDLEKFQEEQELALKELEEKVKNAITVTEKVEVEMQYMDRHSRRLLRLLSKMMLRPGMNSIKGMAVSAALYTQFMKKIINPKTVTKKYQEIKVEDYHDSIKSNIDMLEEAEEILDKTDNQIEKMIKQITEEYADYLNSIPECRELLANLERVRNDLQEKEYEMGKIKEQQIKLLEKNNAKVLTRK